MKGLHYTLLLILILVFLCSLYKIKEGFIDSPVDCRHGGYDRPTDNYTLLNPYNYTQTEFIKLQNVLNKISNSKQVQLKNIKGQYQYIPATTDEEIIRELDGVSQLIIQKLNEMYSEPNYQSQFSKTDYDHITVTFDHQNNLNLDFEVFVQEKQRFPYGIQLRVNAIKYNMNPQDMIGNNRIVKNIKNQDAPFHLPSRSLNNDIMDQNGEDIIPPPLNVLSTPHWPILDTINWQSPKPVLNQKAIHINSIKTYNSNLIINPDKFARRIDGGVTDTTLESNCYNNARNYRAEPNVISNKWIPLESEPKCLKQYPCVPVSQGWDSLGVKKPLKPQTPLCNGLRSSTTQAPLRAEFNPTIHTNPRNEGLYSWMFDLYNKQGSGRQFI